MNFLWLVKGGISRQSLAVVSRSVYHSLELNIACSATLGWNFRLKLTYLEQTENTEDHWRKHWRKQKTLPIKHWRCHTLHNEQLRCFQRHNLPHSPPGLLTWLYQNYQSNLHVPEYQMVPWRKWRHWRCCLGSTMAHRCDLQTCNRQRKYWMIFPISGRIRVKTRRLAHRISDISITLWTTLMVGRHH